MTRACAALPVFLSGVERNFDVEYIQDDGKFDCEDRRGV